MNKPDDDEPFLSRWSRMKQRAARTDAPTEQPVPTPPADAATQPDALRAPEPAGADASQPDAVESEAPLDLEKLPRIEELTAESDIAAFLDLRVPAALRNAALARIWTLDPNIRDFIEVAENQWNWNIPGGAPFYELIEEGSTAGLSFADATSAISRTLTSTDAPPDETGPATENLIEISDQRKIDPTDAPPVAAQEEPAPPHLASVSRSDISSLPLQAVEPPAPRMAAAQQNPAPLRRRHGGALPG